MPHLTRLVSQHNPDEIPGWYWYGTVPQGWFRVGSLAFTDHTLVLVGVTEYEIIWEHTAAWSVLREEGRGSESQRAREPV